MTLKPQIILFDIDGVLLESRGYRIGLRQSIAYFIGELGLDDRWLPDESEVAAFEAIGITSEWDMIPIWLAMVLESMARANSGPVDWPDWPTVVEWTRASNVAIKRKPLVETIFAIRPLLPNGIIASETILEACLQQRFGPLQTISAQGVLQELLKSTREFSASRMTQVFQAFILGSETYAHIYRCDTPVACSSALESHDRPYLLPHNAARLKDLHSEHQIAMAAFTARPSLPLDGYAEIRVGYSPEAEIALRTLEMSHIPLVGYGAMMHVADRTGLRADGLLKPAAFQALAAIAAAWTDEVLPSLEWACAFNRHSEPNGSFPDVCGSDRPTTDLLPVTFDLHVFEDTSSGIRSVRRAAELLDQSGVRANVNAWGIATNGDKKTALEEVGAVVYPDVNQALRAAFPQWF